MKPFLPRPWPRDSGNRPKNGVPGAGMLGFVALLLAISQIGGQLLILIWGGAAWWLFAQDQQVWGIFMIVWGHIRRDGRQLTKPWLIGFGVEMPMSLSILGVFDGFLAFGFLGLFIEPTLIAITFTLLQARRAAVSGHPTVEAKRPAAWRCDSGCPPCEAATRRLRPLTL